VNSTNKTGDLHYAISSLQRAVDSSSNTWEAAQAWGRIGDCYFELGARDSYDLTNAITAYLNVIDAPAGRGVAKNEARFKLAATFERQAALKTGDEQTALFKEALHQYETVFGDAQRDPEGPSALWVERSGVEAGRLAESMQQWDVAMRIYTKLKELLPGMASFFDKKIAKAGEHH